MLNVISGFYRPSRGRIYFEGKDRTHLAAHDVARLGFARTFQNIALFKGMATLDNIMTGRSLKIKGNFLTDALYWGFAQKEETRAARARREDHRLPRDPGDPEDTGGQAPLRPAEARGAGAGAGDGAQGAAARRADGRDERRGEAGHGPLHPRRQRPVGHDDHADRARHGRGDGHLRTTWWCWTTAGRSPTARRARCGRPTGRHRAYLGVAH